MKDIKACLSHNSDNWATPSNLYQAFMDHGFVDPCPLNCEDNNLYKPYFRKKIFINPPFSKLSDWTKYAVRLALLGNVVYFLMPVRTDTKYFYFMYSSGLITRMILFNHRLRFNDSKSAPFPSMLLILNCNTLFESFKVDCLSVNDFINKFIV